MQGSGALGTQQNGPASLALPRFTPRHQQILHNGVPEQDCAPCRQPRCCQVPVSVQPGSFCLLAACATGQGLGIFPMVQPSAPPPSLQVSSRASPGGALPGVCRVLAALTPAPMPQRGFAARGAEAKGWGSRETVVRSSSHKGCQLGLHHAVLCREPEAAVLAGLHLRCQTSHPQGPCSGSPSGYTAMTPAPQCPSGHQVCSPAIARAGLLLPIHWENSPKACGSSSRSRLCARLLSGFVFPKGFAVPLLGSAFLP